MKWIVFWIVTEITVAACPAPPITIDEFGVESGGYTITLESCYDSTNRPMSRKFATKKEAEAFIDRGKDRCSAGNYYSFDGKCDLSGWSIREIDK